MRLRYVKLKTTASRRAKTHHYYYLDADDKSRAPSLNQNWAVSKFKPTDFPFGQYPATKDPALANHLLSLADDRARRRLDAVFLRSLLPPPPKTPRHPTNLTLFPFQRPAVEYMLSQNRVYLAADPGTGKTIMAACMLNALRSPTIYICPPYLVENVRTEIEKWCPGRHPALWGDLEMRPTIIMSDTASLKKESVPFIQAYFRAMRVRGAEPVVVVDEAHRFKSPTTARTKWLFGRVLMEQPTRTIFMSGTPMPNRPRELYTIVSRAAPELIDFKKFDAYGRKFCGAKFNGFGWEYNGESNLDELRERLSRFLYRIPKWQIPRSQLPGKYESCVIISKEATQELVEMERTALRDLSPEDVMRAQFDEPCIATYRRLLGVYKAPLAARLIKYWLDSFDQDKFLVFCEHREVITILSELLSDYRPIVITGSTPTSIRQAQVNVFNADKSRRIYLAQTRAGGVGFNLPSANQVVMVETPWVPGDIDQSSDRAHRLGQLKDVYVRHLVVKNSLDRRVIESVLKKRETISNLYGEKGRQ